MIRFDPDVNGVVAYVAGYADPQRRMMVPHDRYLLIEDTDTLTRLIEETVFKDAHLLIYFVARGQVIYNVIVPETCLRTDINADELPLREDLLGMDEMIEASPETDGPIETLQTWRYPL